MFSIGDTCNINSLSIITISGIVHKVTKILTAQLTLSALTRISFPAVANIVLSILVAVPVWRLATRCAAVWDLDCEIQINYYLRNFKIFQ